MLLSLECMYVLAIFIVFDVLFICSFSVCKYFATELRDRLAASAKSKEVIETGHGLEKKKRFAYLKSWVDASHSVVYFCTWLCIVSVPLFIV